MRVLAVLLAGLALSACSVASRSSPPPASVSEAIRTGVTPIQDQRLAVVRADVERRIARGELVGVSIGVAQGGTVIWSEGFGFADRERAIAVTPDSSFRLASLSKSIAATILFTLVEQGRISLDDRVNDLIAPHRLTGYGGNDADAVTVRDLLATTGGVPHGWYVAESLEALPDLQTLAPWMGMVVFEPGATWEYSNFSLGLTELVVEAVTGEGYEVYARRALFDPLRMTSTAVTEEARVADRLVAAYNSRGERIDGQGVSSPFGGLGMVSSANDLLRFGLFHEGVFDGVATPVGPANRALMHHERTISPIFRLGWYEVNGDLVSNGSAGGTNSTLVIDPDQDLVIVVLSNAASQNAVADTIAGAIKEALEIPPPSQRFEYADFAAEYETRYAPTPALEGTWIGPLQWPNGGALSASLRFDEEGAELTVEGNAPVRISNPVFNRHGRFEGRAALTQFPAFFEGDPADASGRLSLQLTDGVLAGYIRIDRGSDTRLYALPVYARFERSP